jgi:two-component system CheB/CheR fusion protein
MKKLNRNLQIGYGFSIIILLFIGIFSYYTLHNLLESDTWVKHSNLVMQKLEKIASTMKDAETGQRGFLLTGQKEFLEPYNGSYSRSIDLIWQVKQLTRDNLYQQQNIDKLKDVLVNRLNILQELIDRKEKGGQISVDDLRKGKDAMDALRTAVDRAEKDEEGLLNQRTETLGRYALFTPIIIALSILLAVVISVIFYLRVIRDINEKDRLRHELEIKERETAEINIELAAANEELAAANEELIAANEENVIANKELASANERTTVANEELAYTNEELAVANEELAALNEEYITSNEDLIRSRGELEVLNDELEQRVQSRTKDLQESEKRFRNMMETIPQIAWTNTISGEFNFYNRRWYDYTGFDAAAPGSWSWEQAIHHDDLEYSLQQHFTIMRKGMGGEFEARKKRHDGEHRWHLIRIMPVKNEADKIQLWVGTATDIHELKMIQQQKDDFISIASHELRTPITTLKASLQLLNRVKDNPTSHAVPDMIERANKSLDRVNKLIEDLLNFSKFNQGQLQLNKTNFNISKLIEDCCQHIIIAGKYDIIITGDMDVEVYADASRIDQVVINFVNNAMKYAPESKEIIIHIQKKENEVMVSVTDRGKGIPSDKIPRLFDRYFRADSSGSQYSGLGIGLYICAEIIKRHEGTIGVDSKLNQGSTFWFTLPLS